MKAFEDLMKEFLKWSMPTFSGATPMSSMKKLREEIDEVQIDLVYRVNENLPEEYADCLMCLLDSAARAGITVEHLKYAFQKKLEVNKKRTWVKKPNNTYDHDSK